MLRDCLPRALWGPWDLKEHLWWDAGLMSRAFQAAAYIVTEHLRLLQPRWSAGCAHVTSCALRTARIQPAQGSSLTPLPSQRLVWEYRWSYEPVILQLPYGPVAYCLPAAAMRPDFSRGMAAGVPACAVNLERKHRCTCHMQQCRY